MAALKETCCVTGIDGGVPSATELAIATEAGGVTSPGAAVVRLG